MEGKEIKCGFTIDVYCFKYLLNKVINKKIYI